MPLLVCIPVYSSVRGFTCGVPSHRMLLFASALFGCLLLLIGLVNIVDNKDRLSLGSGLVALFVVGVWSFVAIGLWAERNSSRALTTAGFRLWLAVYIGFICLCIVSITSCETLEKTSVNGRCPLTLWLFDWCERVSRVNATRPETTTQLPQPNVTDAGSGQAKVPESSPERRQRVLYYLGIFVLWLAAIKLFTLYGAIMYDLKHRLNWPPPVVTMERPEEMHSGDA